MRRPVPLFFGSFRTKNHLHRATAAMGSAQEERPSVEGELETGSFGAESSNGEVQARWRATRFSERLGTKARANYRPWPRSQPRRADR
jgi:hypothetical protein